MTGDCPCCTGGPVLGRRRLLSLAAGGVAALTATASASAQDAPAASVDPEDAPAADGFASLSPTPLTPPPPGPRHLKFRHLHTEQNLEVVYWDGGKYVWDALQAVNQHLSDFRSLEVHPIDVRLLDILFTLQSLTGSKEPYRIVSAFRSAATNTMLAGQSAATNGTSQVATRSLHMEGKAIDMRLNDVSLTGLRDAALALKGGGVGYYPDSGFIHVDIGSVRTWQGT
ncbi:MAG: DUF882 domain-containing protein [Caulobacter sp.]|nr:DUF882 domain-containing protein [Caulobacter sp.]